MADLLKAANELGGLAEQAGLPLDKFVKVLTVLNGHQLAEQSERRARSEEKEAISKAIASLNGELSSDIAVSDILAKAGVRKSQGTAGFAKREAKRVLEIAHQKN